MKINDLVHIPPVRTVVRLADLADPDLRRHMIETFVLTGEVSFVLTTVLEKIANRQGRGFFVIGNYGSGKSHLLNILSLLLTDPKERDNFLATCKDPETGALLRPAAALRPLAVEISLVEHSARENLEQIVLSRVAEKLRSTAAPAADLPAPPAEWLEMSRPEAFRNLRELLAHGGWGGLLLLIDELSEFLRSKEDPRAYNEDIRFLQFLGEFAENIPGWVIATMQENIENTGALSGEVLHKIKDRYPIRFRLSGEHVKEIVKSRLVRKKPTAAEALPEIYNKLQQSFGKLPFSRSDFTDLYPVHPSTVEFLDELRPLFSQHRGVVDFIHYRLAGDRSRDIDSFLERPAHLLLTPDYIFDHFRDRLRETVETNPYSEQVHRHFEREAENIFEDPADARVGLSLLKLLILGALAPAPKAFTPTELTRLLLHCYSEVESAVNYEYIAQLLELMQARGAYIATARSKTEGETVYTIDLKADMSLLLQKKLDYIAGAFAPGDPKIIEGLLPWIDESHLPLSRLQQETQFEEEISWQNTRRRGKIFYGVPAELSSDYLEELREALETTETDFLFFLLPPAFGVSDTPAAGQAEGEAGALLRGYMALWTPREILASEEADLRRAYACRLLQEEYAADESPVGQQVKKQLEIRLAGEKERVREIFREIYTQGELYAAGRPLSLSSLTYLPFFALVSQCAAEILKARFPRHLEICPRSEQISASLLQRALDLLSASPLEDEMERGVRAVIENYLQPLDLVKKKGRNWRLELNPKVSPLLAKFFSLIPDTGRAGLNRVYWILRKGPFGLSKEGFQALTAAAVQSGAVSAYQGGRKLAPGQVNIFQLERVNELGPGTLIRPELQKTLAEIPFLPARLRGAPLTFFSQQQAWEAVTAFKEEWGEKLTEVNNRLERLKEYHLFATVDWRQLENTLHRFWEFLNEIKVSYTSQEGLERFLAAYQSRPLLAGDFQRLETLADFLTAGLPEILRMGHYLKDPALTLPPEERYQNLRRRSRFLLELLADEAIFWEKTAQEKAEQEFSLFLAEYIPLYLEEHDKAVGPERLRPYRDLTTSEAYRLLERLGRLNAVVVKDDIISINRELARPLERECGAAEEPLLKDRPTCSCGFRLGEKVELPEVTTLRERILLGIRSYLERLREEENHRRLKAYAENLEVVGRRRETAPLKELLETTVDRDETELLPHLENLINQSVVAHLNRALTGDAIIVERHVTELQEMLADRVFTIAQLQEIFQAWLTGSETELPEYIRVTGEAGENNLGASTEAAVGEVKLFLQERFPRLVPIANRLGEIGLFALALLTFWFIRRHPAMGRQGEITGADGTGGAFPETTGAEVNRVEAARSLAVEYFSLREDEWIRRCDDLTKLGEAILVERETLPPGFLEEAAETVGARVPPKRLLELYYQGKPSDFFRFEPQLELLMNEPFFPMVSREIAKKLAGQIADEEQPANLRVITASLRESLKNLEEDGPVLTPALLKEKKAALSFLETMASAKLLLRETERTTARPPGEDKGWERFYRLLSSFELLQGRLEESPLRTLAPGSVLEDWRRQYIDLLQPLLEEFGAYYSQEAPSHRQTLRSLIRQAPGWAAREGGGRGGLFLLLLDGARLDVANALLERLLVEQELTLLREGLLWAAPPTVTRTQLQPLQEERLIGHILHVDERLVAEALSDPGSFLPAVDNSDLRSDANAPLTMLKLDYVDEKAHASRDALPILMEEILLQSKKRLEPLLASFPVGSLILLAADHGFITNLRFDKQNKEDPLYLHGGSSFFEVLAPWSLLRKI